MLRVEERPNAHLRCALCHDELPASAESWICELCDTRLRRDCGEQLGRCPTIGCRGWSPRVRPLRRDRSYQFRMAGYVLAAVVLTILVLIFGSSPRFVRPLEPAAAY